MSYIAKAVESRNREESNAITALGLLAYLHMTALLTYRDENDKGTAREVLPLELWRAGNGSLILTAFCFLRNQVRTFHVDRMLSFMPGNTYAEVESFPLLPFALQAIDRAAEHGIKLSLSDVVEQHDDGNGDAFIIFKTRNGRQYMVETQDLDPVVKGVYDDPNFHISF